MTRWKWVVGVVAVLMAVFYVACQADNTPEEPVDSDARPIIKVAPDMVDHDQAGDQVSEPVADAEPQEKPSQTPAEMQEQAPAEKPEEVVEEVQAGMEQSEEPQFAANAFPPTVSDAEYHQDAWYKDDCLRCHETGVKVRELKGAEKKIWMATRVKHEGMEPILLKAKCRSCHVLIPGQAQADRAPAEEEQLFAQNAFPPMIPASESHREAWQKDNCLLCHEDGNRGAPIVKHEGMPPLLLKAKCRSCHVQVRSAAFPGR